jgi:hypothetical protein
MNTIYRTGISLFFLASLSAAVFLFTSMTSANNKPCQFNTKTMQFAGTPLEQARCLLRPNMIGGALGEPLKKLPKPLNDLIGKKVKVSRDALRKYLKAARIDVTVLGGSLDDPLSTGKLPHGAVLPALYFVIHDTSSPYLKDDPFPSDMNEASYKGNKLEGWLKYPVAHVFVNRVGESLTVNKFSETVRSGWGTKFSRDHHRADGKGLQLHIELVQPRRRDPANANEKNDRIAPMPGFTDKQYERLVLLYVCASVRRGSWLIPAFHSAIDAGIKDAHDDPQNFELEKFAKALENLVKKIK